VPVKRTVFEKMKTVTEQKGVSLKLLKYATGPQLMQNKTRSGRSHLFDPKQALAMPRTEEKRQQSNYIPRKMVKPEMKKFVLISPSNSGKPKLYDMRNNLTE
jgi:hypothetical protein